MFPPYQCIFCKSTSNSFASVEHIIPESLGNIEHVLPNGVVCDKCNHYFGTKVEGPILGSDFFRQARHRNGIANKRSRIPTQEGLSFPDGIALEIGYLEDGSRYLAPVDESSNKIFAERILQRKQFSLIFPTASPPERRLFARFLLVMGLKATAHRMLVIEGGIKSDHIDNLALEEARQFTRYGSGPEIWPFHEVRIYPEGRHFDSSESSTGYDIPHEFTLLYTDHKELFFVVAIFGVQYAINLGGPELDGFHTWLAENNNQSPLYPDGI